MTTTLARMSGVREAPQWMPSIRVHVQLTYPLAGADVRRA